MTSSAAQPDPQHRAPSGGPRRTTRRRVRIVDSLTRIGITVGGLAVIVAVLGIMVYLVSTVLPLLRGGSASLVAVHDTGVQGVPALMEVDEYGKSAVVLLVDGSYTVLDLATGARLLEGRFAPEGRTLTAWSSRTEAGTAAFGYDDGTVQTGRLRFDTSFVDPAGAPPEFQGLAPGERRPWPDGGIVQMTSERQLRLTSLAVELSDPVPLESGSGAVRRVDYRAGGSAEYLLTLREDGTGELGSVRTIRPLGGGKPRVTLATERVVFTPPAGAGIPDWFLVTTEGDQVYAAWADGTCQRYAPAGGDDLVLQQTLRLVPEGGSITALEMLLGARTLIVGDDRGTVQGWFAARQVSGGAPDRYDVVRAHEFAAANRGPVTALGISRRDRTFVVGDTQGGVAAFHMTSGKRIVDLAGTLAGAVREVQVTPKADGIVAFSAGGRLALWALAPGHPEASLRSLFGRVWYEGEAAPAFTYQSSAGEDTAEIKLSLTPLIFGTFKATIYALLFAVPIAILAAIYTSEILHPHVRLAVKPVIELMASLPSVVLGFVAAIAIAPLARDWLPHLLLGFGVVPFGVLLAAYLWQSLPVRVTARASSWQHLALVSVVLLAGIGASGALGGLFERALFSPSTDDVLVLAGSYEPVPPEHIPEWARAQATFTSSDARALRAEGMYVRSGTVVRATGHPADPEIAGVIARSELDRPSIRRWLDGTIGGSWAGWVMIMMIPATIIAVLVRSRTVDPYLSWIERSMARGGAVLELAKFLVTVAISIGLALSMAGLLTSMGLDTRDSVFGTFSQRNTLVVGIVMGFAIIPIIYTISEDAMTSVPEQLRSASLGCGATRWQTAIRVVLPLALSGIFSACMIGLGRAAGETMIVLMATGNTPTMDWNIFSGFRTLSANLAVELPEAVATPPSTHYRVLFLGALCLFVITFVVNTAAEFVRHRVRRRTAAL